MCQHRHLTIGFDAIDTAIFPVREDDASLLIEGDIFAVRFAPRAFDCVIMLDSVEHVPDPAAFIGYAHRVLDDGGHFLVDTGPLYYSIVGHHLWGQFPAARYPWVHLWRDFERLIAAKAVDQWSLDRFQALNKVTHDELRDMFAKAGFDIVAEHRSVPDDALALASPGSAIGSRAWRHIP